MSNHRRRACDFTDSLITFRQTISEEESDQTVSQASSENRLEYIRNKQREEDKQSCLKYNKSRDSIILAGSLANQQCISLPSCNIIKKNYNIVYNNRQFLSEDAWNISDETSYMSIKPDLNKCINLFHNEHLLKEYYSLEELNTTSEIPISKNINICDLSKNMAMGQRNLNKRPRSISADSLINTNLFNRELRRSKSYSTLDRIWKRDSNYNIKPDKLAKIDYNEKVKTIISPFNALLLSKSSAFSSKKDNSSMEDQKHSSVSSEKSSKEELNPFELKALLHLLGDEKPLNESTCLFRRLSTNYYDAPKNFTEGLLTIIEESVVSNDSLQYPEVSSRAFNKELRKMRKFIEDETVPEWPQSPSMLTPICTRRKSQELKSNLSLHTPGTFNKDCILGSPLRNIKSPKKIRKRISKNTSYVTKNLLHDSTSTFENLETYCKEMYPDEYKPILTMEENQLQSPLQNMVNIRYAYESQMASLEDSFNIYEEIKKAETCTSADQHIKTSDVQDLQHRLVSCEKYDTTDSEKVSDMFKWRTKRSKHEMIEMGDFESSLMYEIAKERQRCLDMVKTITETTTNLDEETCPKIIITGSSPITNDAKFMKILLCVMKYQDYLEEKKPMLNLLYQTRLSGTPRHKNDVRAKKMFNKKTDTCPLVLSRKKPTLRTPKLSPRKKSTSPLSKHRSTTKTPLSKSRLFVTPEKTSVNKNCRPKCTYFPNLLPGLNKQNEPNSTKKIHRQMRNYNHIISPVGMYIRGAESHLKKNVQPKTDEMLLTSQCKKQTIKVKPTMSLPDQKIKFRPSPKCSKENVPRIVMESEEDVADDFPHSKVHSKLSSHVHMTKEAENRRMGNRMNEFLRSSQNICMMQHEDHMKSVQMDHSE